MQIRYVCGAAAALVGLSLLAGCAESKDPALMVTGSIPTSDQRPSDEPVALGKVHFANGEYGLAERQFRSAVERNRLSAEAWLGLAASYDRLARFDLADRAYRQVVKLRGYSAEVHNNLGYHHLLKGDVKQARVHLLAAAQMDPADPLIQGNLHMLETWKTGDAAVPN